uniref:DUF4371 domain-containing protein n=1 Tax=Gopherus agassizii TaxID=38772 RepID=A0A452HE66_9SAUR
KAVNAQQTCLEYINRPVEKDLHDCENVPNCWTSEQAQYFLKKYYGLIIEGKKLGCSHCAKTSHLGVLGGKSLHISSEQQKCTIKAPGTDKKSSASFFKKKSEGTFRIKLSFENMEDEVELQIKNETDLGNCLHSRFSAIRIVAELIRKQIFSKIIKNYSKICIIIDEASTISSKTVLVILLKCELQDSSPKFFLDLVELESAKAENIYNALRHTLTDTGFDTEYLKKNLIGFCSDGTSTMLGHKSGVAARLIEDFPNIIIWHCLNHRLQLTLDYAINDKNEISLHFKIFLDKIYAIFHQSNKSQFELKQVSEELYIEIIKIGHGFALALMIDILDELALLSNALQARQLNSFGIHVNKINEMIESDAFKCIEFEDNVRFKSLPQDKVIEYNLGHSRNTPKIVELFNVMDPTSWNIEEVRLSWKSGEKKVHELSKFIKFVVNLNDFCGYVDNNIQSKNLPDLETIRKAKHIMNTIAISSAEAERTFSLMNIICSKKRTNLTIKHISSFMTINLLGKPLSSRNPIAYVKSWMKSHRSALDTRVRVSNTKDYGEDQEAIWKLLPN